MKCDLYQYTDYRKFLADFYKEKKKENKHFSYRSFAKAAGLSTGNYLWQVISGRCNLGNENIRKFCKGLRLKRHEAEHFENLVHFNQARASDEANLYYQKLASSKRYLKVRRLEKDHYEFFSRWYYVAIHELVLLPDFCEDPQWIASRLKPAITPREVNESLKLLFRLGLLCRNEEGRIVQTATHVTSGSEIAPLAVTNFHRQMITRAAEALEELQQDQRDISSLTVAVSKEKIAEVRRRIHEFKRSLHAFMASGEQADTVYQLNLQLFSLCGVPNEASARPCHLPAGAGLDSGLLRPVPRR